MKIKLEFGEPVEGEILASAVCEYIASGDRIQIEINGITHTYAISYTEGDTMAYARPSQAIHGRATNVSVDWKNKELAKRSFPILFIAGSVNKPENTSHLTFWCRGSE